MKSKIIITLEGGLVQHIQSNIPVEYMLIDVDECEYDDENLTELFPGEDPVWVSVADTRCDPEEVSKTFDFYNKAQERMHIEIVCGDCGHTKTGEGGFCARCRADNWIEFEDMKNEDINISMWKELVKLIKHLSGQIKP